MILERLHPRRIGFIGGCLVGFLIALFAFGDLAHFLAFVHPDPVAAQTASAPAVRIMDGAHVQLATVSHTGRLLVDTGSTSGLTDHITSVVHIAAADGGLVIRDPINTGARARVDHTGALVTSATVTVTTDNVNVFHQSTVRHISSETHIAGALMLRDKLCLSCVARIDHTGALATTATVTVTTDNINVFHQSTIRHISSVTHVAGYGAFHITGVGVPGQSHGGVLTIQGITGANAVAVAQSTAAWNIQHISSAIHLAGGVTDNANSALRVTGVTVFTVMGAIDHIAGSLHIAGTISGAQLHIQGLGTPGASHGGVLTVQGITGMNALSISQSVARWNIDHVTSQVHVAGAIMIRDKLCASCVARVDHTGALVTSATVTVTTDNVNVFHQSTIRHISGSVHIAGTISGAQFHIQGLGIPGGSHGGVLTVQGITGMNAIAVSQSGQWGVSSAQSGVWTIQAAHQGGEWNLRHATSVTHIVGSVRLMSGTPNNQLAVITHFGALAVTCYTAAGATETCGGTGGSGDAVNVFHQSTVRHISSVTHVAVAQGHYAAGGLSIHVSGISNVGSGAPNTGTTAMVCHSTLAVHVTAAAPGYTQLIHLTSSNNGIDQRAWRIYICGIVLVSAHAQAFSLLEGVGTTCATGKRPVIGAWRPDDAFVMAASGGISSVAAFPWISTQNPGNNLCIVQTSRTSGSVSGVITYRAGP